MKFNKVSTAASSILGVVTLISSATVFAGGFEKNIFFSGRYSGVGGAAAAIVSGPEAMYWNPAGLVTKAGKQEMTFDLSPTQSQFSGTFPNGTGEVKSDNATTSPGGIFYNYGLNDKVGLGFGFYTVAGAYVKYKDVNMGNSFQTLRPTITNDLAVYELAAGAGYKVNDQLKLGAAWRISMARANLQSGKLTYSGATPVALAGVDIKNLKGTEVTGFRLGAQYQPMEHLDIGLDIRTEVNFTTKGQASAQIQTLSSPTTITYLTDTDATVKTSAPMQISLGAGYDVMPQLKILGEYVFTQYSKVDSIKVEGTLSNGSALGNIDLNFKDMTNIRIGGEYTGYALPIRAGYVYTSTVTNEGYARPTFTPPGPAHTFVVGTGYGMMDNKLKLDGGLEMTTFKATVSNVAQADTSTGDYSAKAYALHLGATYEF